MSVTLKTNAVEADFDAAIAAAGLTKTTAKTATKVNTIPQGEVLITLFFDPDKKLLTAHITDVYPLPAKPRFRTWGQSEALKLFQITP